MRPRLIQQANCVSAGLSLCAAGGLQVSGWAGRDPGGQLCCSVLLGLLFLGWDPLITDHCTGRAFLGASSWS